MPIGADFSSRLNQPRPGMDGWRLCGEPIQRSRRSLAWERSVRRPPAMRLVIRSCVVLVVFWFNAAAAQEGYLGHDHDKWHRSFYQMLLRPDTKTPCCNLTDCRPTSGKRVDDHYEVKVNGAWVSVPPSKILKQSAPDLGFHVRSASG